MIENTPYESDPQLTIAAPASLKPNGPITPQHTVYLHHILEYITKDDNILTVVDDIKNGGYPRAIWNICRNLQPSTQKSIHVSSSSTIAPSNPDRRFPSTDPLDTSAEEKPESEQPNQVSVNTQQPSETPSPDPLDTSAEEKPKEIIKEESKKLPPNPYQTRRPR